MALTPPPAIESPGLEAESGSESATVDTEAVAAQESSPDAGQEAELATVDADAVTETEALPEAEQEPLVTIDPATIAEIDAQAAEAEALAELESMMSDSGSLAAYDTDCAVGAVFAIGDGCVVEGVGHFYVEDDGQDGSLGTFSTDAWPDAEGYSTVSTSTSEIKVDEYSDEPDDQFGAINNEDGTWTVTALP